MAGLTRGVEDLVRTLSDASPAVWASKQIARVGEAASTGLDTAKTAARKFLTPTSQRGDIELPAETKRPIRRRSLRR